MEEDNVILESLLQILYNQRSLDLMMDIASIEVGSEEVASYSAGLSADFIDHPEKQRQKRVMWGMS